MNLEYFYRHLSTGKINAEIIQVIKYKSER